MVAKGKAADGRRPLMVRLSRDVHRELKVRAARDERSVQEVVEELIVDYLVRMPRKGAARAAR